MSFSLAFWVGPKPVDDQVAAVTFEQLHARYVEGGEAPAAPELLAFLDEITKRYPDLMDLDDDHVDDGVWSDGPLTNNATGTLLYLGIVSNRAEEVTSYLVEVAARHGLTAFDPQAQRLLHP